jgi:hypothetical protein
MIVDRSSSVGAVNWDLIVISTESMSLGVMIREDSSLEYLII